MAYISFLDPPLREKSLRSYLQSYHVIPRKLREEEGDIAKGNELWIYSVLGVRAAQLSALISPSCVI
jgi:hypothetical protein